MSVFGVKFGQGSEIGSPVLLHEQIQVKQQVQSCETARDPIVDLYLLRSCQSYFEVLSSAKQLTNCYRSERKPPARKFHPARYHSYRRDGPYF